MQSDLTAALQDCRRTLWGVALFSAIVNILMLAGPLYMLQIYDRVLSSRSVPTLLALTVFLIGAYAFQGLLDMIRSRIVVRAAALLDSHLGQSVHRAVIALSIRSKRPSEAQQPVRDLDSIRAFLTSAGPTAILDLPWVPFFLAICFLIHPWLGYLSLAGLIVLLGLTIQTERASRSLAQAANEQGGARAVMIESHRRNSASVVSMGMGGTLTKRWEDTNNKYIGTVIGSTDVINSYGSVTRVLRLFLQSAILGVGAYLVIRQELTPGAMIAASIMMGRALAPLEVAIANWRGFVAARDAMRRLRTALNQLPKDERVTTLPTPSERLELEQVVIAAPGATSAIAINIQFRLTAGEALGVIGPNGSGKSSLSRVLTGIWPPARGTVRLDGAELDQWDPELRGRHIGYLAQIVELFPGTVAENIARMEPNPDSEAVLRAAQAAGAHDMILKLPNGYDTVIGDNGEGLSVGQRQRIALARALYGEPFLVVLDEPGASLDGEGEAALQQTVKALKDRGAITIMVVHRPSSLILCDKVLLLMNGAQRAFGPRDEVLRKMAEGRANLTVVADAAPAAKEER